MSSVDNNATSQNQVLLGFVMISFGLIVGGIKLRCLVGANDMGVDLGNMSEIFRLLGVGVSVMQLGAGVAWLRERNASAMRWTIMYASVAIGHTLLVWLWGWHVQFNDGSTGGYSPADCPGALGCLLASAVHGLEQSKSALRATGNGLLMTAGIASGLWPLFLLCCHRLWRRQTLATSAG